jgi:hypothetical protein
MVCQLTFVKFRFGIRQRTAAVRQEYVLSTCLCFFEVILDVTYVTGVRY